MNVMESHLYHTHLTFLLVVLLELLTKPLYCTLTYIYMLHASGTTQSLDCTSELKVISKGRVRGDLQDVELNMLTVATDVLTNASW